MHVYDVVFSLYVSILTIQGQLNAEMIRKIQLSFIKSDIKNICEI